MGIKRKSHFKGSQEAVSEIIGTLLILAITVILFSTVLFYVAQIPPPHQNTNVDFGTEPIIQHSNGTNMDTWVNVTMGGGQTLNDGTTSIAVFVNEAIYQNKVFKIADSNPSIGTDWKIGETWSLRLNNIPLNSSIRVMVLDSSSNSVVWESKLPLPIKSIPVIADRGMTPSMPIIDNKSYLWVQVYDYDGAILSVKADMSGLGQAEGNIINFIDRGNDLWESPQLTVNANWTNANILLTAMDNDLQSATARMDLDATTSGSSGGSDDSGYEPQNIIYSKSNGFNIFEKDDWDANAFNATPTYSFTLNADDAAVVVVSKSLLNTDSKNYISVIKADDKQVVYEKTSNAFTRYRYTSGYYSYKAYLDIDSINGFSDNSKYIVQIRLEDNSNPTNKIFINHNISTGTGGTSPTIKLYNDTAYTKLDSNYYNNEIFYVEIKGSSLPAGWSFYPSGGEVIIRDFVGGTQVKIAPPSSSTAWNGPISGVSHPSADTYRFAVNLTAAKLGDPWIPGKNQGYVISFDMFTIQIPNGTGYDYKTFYLNAVVYITSPVFSGGIAAGIVQGCTPVFGTTQGLSAWTQSSSMLYYVNDNTWTPPEYMEPFNQWSDYRPQGLLVTSGDMNGDGENNEVVAYLTLCVPQSSASSPNTNTPIYQSYWVPKLALYERSDTGGWSSKVIRTMTETGASGTTFTQIKSLAVGNVDMDDDKDVIFGMANGSLGICRNDGFWSYRQITKVSSSIIAVGLADLDGNIAGHDRARSLDIVFACRDGSVYIMKNTDGMGTFSTPRKAVTATSSLTYATSLCLGDMTNDGLTDLIVIGGTASGGMVYLADNAQLNSGSPTFGNVFGSWISAFSLANAPKTNVTIGNYLSKDVWPDIAVAVGGVGVAAGGGVYFIKHTALNAYVAPVRTITNIATEADGTCVAKIQCMISVDIDNDGLLDLVVSTGDSTPTSTRVVWRGNVLVFLNTDGTGAFARYEIDNTGVPVRSVTVLI
jgi:hypothetical protein